MLNEVSSCVTYFLQRMPICPSTMKDKVFNETWNKKCQTTTWMSSCTVFFFFYGNSSHIYKCLCVVLFYYVNIFKKQLADETALIIISVNIKMLRMHKQTVRH